MDFFIVCLDIKLQTSMYTANEMEWNIGNCSKTKYYEAEKLYSENCCLIPGEYILKCAKDVSYGWREGALDIEGHTFCDDMQTYKAMQMIKITGILVRHFKIFIEIFLLLQCRF